MLPPVRIYAVRFNPGSPRHATDGHIRGQRFAPPGHHNSRSVLTPHEFDINVLDVLCVFVHGLGPVLLYASWIFLVHGPLITF